MATHIVGERLTRAPLGLRICNNRADTPIGGDLIFSFGRTQMDPRDRATKTDRTSIVGLFVVGWLEGRLFSLNNRDSARPLNGAMFDRIAGIRRAGRRAERSS
jgi:hypothetical protein